MNDQGAQHLARGPLAVRMSLLVPLLVMCLGVSGAARAAPAVSQTQELAGQLVALMQLDQQFASMHKQCQEGQESMSPAVLVEKNRDYFGGLRPGHAKWGRLMAAHKLYVQQVCARPTREEYRDLMVASYAGSLTPAQLRSAVQFFGSPSGKALASAFNDVGMRMAEAMLTKTAPHIARATAQYQGEISRLMASP